MKFSTTGQHALAHGIKLCVYGRSGAGKTMLIATAPTPFILSAEAGTLSIAKHNIPMAEITNLAELEEAYNWICQSEHAKPFQTICLDSISEIGERVLTDEKARSKDARAAYGEMQDKLYLWIRKFRDLPGKNVYFSAKAELRQQPNGTVLYGAAMPGQKMTQGLAYFFDEFFYLGIGETAGPVPGVMTQYRYLQTQASNQFDAKDRSGALDAMEQPNLTHIFNKIRLLE